MGLSFTGLMVSSLDKDPNTCHKGGFLVLFRISEKENTHIM